MIDNDAEACLVAMPIVSGAPVALAYFTGDLPELMQSVEVMFMFGILVGVWLSFTARSYDEIARRFRQAKEGWKTNSGLWADYLKDR